MFPTISKKLGSATLCLIVGLIAPASGQDTTKERDAVTEVYSQGIREAKSAYRKALADLLVHCTSAEVFLLDFDIINNGRKMAEGPFASSADYNRFPIRPYQLTTSILAKKILTAEEIKTLLAALQPVLGARDTKYGAMCHFPIHGIRLWSPDRALLFETSFCWHCHNFYVKYPNGDSEWIGISAPELEKAIQHLVPIPETEQKRFNEWCKLGKELPNK